MGTVGMETMFLAPMVQADLSSTPRSGFDHLALEPHQFQNRGVRICLVQVEGRSCGGAMGLRPDAGLERRLVGKKHVKQDIEGHTLLSV